MYQEVISKICITGYMQFKGTSFDQMPIHDNPHTTVIPWWDYTNEQNFKASKDQFICFYEKISA
jgi:hypothetical protein